MNFLRKVRTMLHTSDAPTTHEDITIATRMVGMPQVLEASAENGYLAGQLLVATPVIEAGIFHKSVIYLFSHNALGAMGLIINQPLELLSYNTLLEGMGLPKTEADRDLPVHIGGPVERGRGFVLHSSDYIRDFTFSLSGEIGVTASSGILKDIVAGTGPRHAALIVGCAGWEAGQLEREIEQNAWMNVPATQKLVFNTENDLKWATASKSLGIPDMAFYSTAVGHA